MVIAHSRQSILGSEFGTSFELLKTHRFWHNQLAGICCTQPEVTIIKELKLFRSGEVDSLPLCLFDDISVK